VKIPEEPKLVKITHKGAMLGCDPEELAECLTTDVPVFDSDPDKIQIDLKNLPPLPENKFNALLSLNINFYLSWEMKRTDLIDSTPSGFEMSMAVIALVNGWTHMEVVALWIEFRKKHKLPMKLHESRIKLTLANAEKWIEDHGLDLDMEEEFQEEPETESQKEERREQPEPESEQENQENGYKDEGDGKEQETKGDQKEQSTKGKTQANVIVRLVEREVKEGNATFFHDQREDGFARFLIKGHYEIRSTSSRAFRNWLTGLYYEYTKRVPSSMIIKGAIDTLGYFARMGKECNLSVRTAWDNGAIYYDLGDWRAVKIDAYGWEIVNEPPILFKHFNLQQPQVTPIKSDYKILGDPRTGSGGIFKWVNLKDRHSQILYAVNLVAGLVPDIKKPLDCCHGDSGAGKTSALEVKKLLLDPYFVTTLDHETTKAELIQAMSHNAYFLLTNLTSMPLWLSNLLSQTVEGKGLVKRQLYTDDSDFGYDFKHSFGSDGISLVIERSDLFSRSIIYRFEEIGEEERIPDKDFSEGFNKERPKILGAMFTTLSQMMRVYPEIGLDRTPRMGSFAKYGSAVAVALGIEQQYFLNAYFSNLALQHLNVLESHPIAQALIEFMSRENVAEASADTGEAATRIKSRGKFKFSANGCAEHWIGTPTDLYTQLRWVAEITFMINLNSKYMKWPTDPTQLWKHIKPLQKPLREIAGIEITKPDDPVRIDGKKIRVIEIKKRVLEEKPQTK